MRLCVLPIAEDPAREGTAGSSQATTRLYPLRLGVFVIEYTYRDCLSEEIEILQLMLYRDEFLTLDPKACKHSGPLISIIEENMKELSDLNNQH